VLLAALFVGAWQWVPTIPGLASTWPIFDPFFVSSPSRIGRELWRLTSGANNTPLIYEPFIRSLGTALAGAFVGMVSGCLSGLVCSSSVMLNRIVRPFLVMFNAVPKITLIPVVVLIGGATPLSDATVAFMVVFFLIFFNAYEGGISVAPEILHNARILGCGWLDELRRIRFPFVFAWTFAGLPNAISFGLISSVTAELFTGSSGLGAILLVAVYSANADLTFAVAIVLGTTGVILVLLSDAARARVLHWW
jgi:NitT/TauT family transport system permease protein